jgi:chaperone modulatory protein CbpM
MADSEGTVWLHAQARFRLVDLSDACGLPQEVLRELVEFGVLAPTDPSSPEWDFAADCVPSLRAAARLGADFELETHALALVLSYLRRIEELEAQVQALVAQLPKR